MIRRLSLALVVLTAATLGGCVTDYGYRDGAGAGDYYYGRPSVQYDYDDGGYGGAGYGAPYGSIGYGYAGGIGIGYGYGGYGFGDYGYGYGYPGYYGGFGYSYYPHYWRHRGHDHGGHDGHGNHHRPPTGHEGPSMSGHLPARRYPGNLGPRPERSEGRIWQGSGDGPRMSRPAPGRPRAGESYSRPMPQPRSQPAPDFSPSRSAPTSGFGDRHHRQER
jgi:hypothetical protein